MDDQTSRLVSQLRRVQWDDNAASLARAAQLKEVSSAGARISYRDIDGLAWDVYQSAEGIDFINVDIRTSEPVEDLPTSALERIYADFERGFGNFQKVISKILGAPAFVGGFDDAGFPDDQDAGRLALWPIDKARLMLELKHEGPEFPVRLSLVVAR
jgi:hypothetical protein